MRPRPLAPPGPTTPSDDPPRPADPPAPRQTAAILAGSPGPSPAPPRPGSSPSHTRRGPHRPQPTARSSPRRRRHRSSTAPAKRRARSPNPRLPCPARRSVPHTTQPTNRPTGSPGPGASPPNVGWPPARRCRWWRPSTPPSPPFRAGPPTPSRPCSPRWAPAGLPVRFPPPPRSPRRPGRSCAPWPGGARPRETPCRQFFRLRPADLPARGRHLVGAFRPRTPPTGPRREC